MKSKSTNIETIAYSPLELNGTLNMRGAHAFLSMVGSTTLGTDRNTPIPIQQKQREISPDLQSIVT